MRIAADRPWAAGAIPSDRTTDEKPREESRREHAADDPYPQNIANRPAPVKMRGGNTENKRQWGQKNGAKPRTRRFDAAATLEASF